MAYADSAAFDRDEDAAPLSAIALLMAIAHPPRLSTSATCPSHHVASMPRLSPAALP